jgi:hypothetical protein
VVRDPTKAKPSKTSKSRKPPMCGFFAASAMSLRA